MKKTVMVAMMLVVSQGFAGTTDIGSSTAGEKILQIDASKLAQNVGQTVDVFSATGGEVKSITCDGFEINPINFTVIKHMIINNGEIRSLFQVTADTMVDKNDDGKLTYDVGSDSCRSVRVILK